MAFLLACALGSAPITGCGSTQSASAARTTSAALTVEADPATTKKEDKTAAEKWAEQKALSDANAKSASGDKEGMDPLAMNDALEASSIPKIEKTPARQLRAKSRTDLDAALALLHTESSVDGAAKKLEIRLGKPSWVENGRRRIWIAPAGAQCHRLILEPDGSALVETASTSEWRMLSATARQNPCTGEIRRGIEK